MQEPWRNCGRVDFDLVQNLPMGGCVWHAGYHIQRMRVRHVASHDAHTGALCECCFFQREADSRDSRSCSFFLILTVHPRAFLIIVISFVRLLPLPQFPVPRPSPPSCSITFITLSLSLPASPTPSFPRSVACGRAITQRARRRTHVVGRVIELRKFRRVTGQAVRLQSSRAGLTRTIHPHFGGSSQERLRGDPLCSMHPEATPPCQYYLVKTSSGAELLL